MNRRDFTKKKDAVYQLASGKIWSLAMALSHISNLDGTTYDDVIIQLLDDCIMAGMELEEKAREAKLAFRQVLQQEQTAEIEALTPEELDRKVQERVSGKLEVR